MKKERSSISPHLEHGVRQRARRDTYRRALLSTIALAGALPVAIAAPKVLSLLKQEHVDMVFPTDPRQRLYETASRLKRKGFIEFRIDNGKKRMHLTNAGRRELQRLESTKLPRPRKWDGRWRIVIFDIPEKRKSLREHLRIFVRRLGFLRLQDSVWVYPYDCEEIITLLKTDLRTGRQLLYIIADAIEYDAPLRTHFELSQHR